MAFWGVELKPGRPFTLKATGIKRLHLSQATLGIGNATNRSILQCNIGNKSPLFLCVLTPKKVDSSQLNIEFEEDDDVTFSVLGRQRVHLTGYFLEKCTAFHRNDDESESYAEDIGDSDSEKNSSDDYDYGDSFINDDDTSACRLHASSTDDDEISVKEMTDKKAKKKKRNGRLVKKYQVSDSESDCVEVSSDTPLPSSVTRSKARTSSLENDQPIANCEETSEAAALDKREDKALDDVQLSPVQNGSEILSKRKRNKENSVTDVDEGEGKQKPESVQDDKADADKVIETSSAVLASQDGDDATPSKKKRKKNKREEETSNVQKNLFECSEKNEQVVDNKNMDEDKSPEISSNEVVIEEIEKGKLEGKVAADGKKVSIFYTGKLKDTGKMFESNVGETPFRFRLGAKDVVKGLSNGIEGMRVGDKRRIIIPPSLGYVEEGLKEAVPKNSWLVYEVEAVKVR